MKRLPIILGALVFFLVGFIFLRGPIPNITIAPEELTKAGPIKITNTMFTSWCIVLLLAVSIFLVTRRKWTLIPGGVQNFIEAAVEAFYNLVVGIAGEENGRKFFPVVATIFFFVVISNWLSLTPIFNVVGFTSDPEEVGFVMEQKSIGPFDVSYVPFSGPGTLSGDSISESDGNAVEHHEKAVSEGKFVGELIPLFRGINTDLNTPLAIAIWSAIFVEFWGISSLGLFKYGKKFFNFSSPIAFFVGILEFFSEIIRLVSFTFRLFGNMFAGEVVLLMFTFMTPLLITLPFYGLELFVGVIQAFIFASLTLVFGVMAVSAHDDAHAAEHPGHPEEGSISDSIHDAIAEPIS
ncbi:MAG: F0F1 ATP synthase subunit A [Chloroflexota bacterium]